MLRKKQNIFYKFAILAALNVACAAVFVYETNLIDSKIIAIKSLEDDFNAALIREKTVRGASRLLHDSAQERQILEKIFVPKDDTVTFIERIESSGEKSGVEPAVGSVSVERYTEGFEKITVRLKSNGTWQELTNLILFLEAQPLAIRVHNIHLDLQQSGIPNLKDDNPAPQSLKRDSAWQGAFTISALKLSGNDVKNIDSRSEESAKQDEDI